MDANITPTAEQLASFQPDATPASIHPTSEQLASFQPDESSSGEGTTINPFKEFSPEQLSDLAKNNPGSFDIAQNFLGLKKSNPAIYNDPAIRQKAADALNLVKQDTEKDVLPHPIELVKGGVEGAKSIAVGAGTAVSHAVKAKLFLDKAMRHFFDKSTETSKSATAAQRELAEAWQGIQLSQTGILNQINALQNWAARKGGAVADAVLGLANKHTSDILGTPLALAGTVLKNRAETSPTVENLRRVFSGQQPDSTVGKQFKDYTPEERSRDLENILAQHEQESKIAAGTEGSEISKLTTQGLAEHGLPIRPEESTKLAAADPFALAEFGGAFKAGQIGAKVLGGAVAEALPASVRTVAEAAAKDLAELPRQVAGKAIQAAGAATKGAGKAAEFTGRTAKVAGPIYGAAKGLLTGDWEHILGETVGPRIIGEAAEKAGALAEQAAPKISEFGRQVESRGPIASANAQAVRDILNSAPAVATNIGEGAAFDYGLAQTTGETPEERKGMGLGTIFGALGAGREVGARFLHGQLIEPKAFKAVPTVASTRSFPALEAMHADAVKGAPKADVNKINAVRALAQKYGATTDAFLAPDPVALKTALVDSGVSPETADLYSKQNGAFIANLPDKNGQAKPVVIVNTGDAAPHELKHVFQQALGEEANKQVDDFIGSRYSPEEIDAEGQRCAQSTGGAEGNWVDSILKNSNWGEEEAKAKLGREVLSQVPGADPKMESKWGQMAYDDLLERSGSKPGTAWEVLLSPEEKLEAARKFMKREIAARNFEAIFNNTAGTLTDAKGVLPGLARLVNRVTTTFGAAGTQGVSTEGGRVERPVMEAVQRAVKGLNPDVVEPVAVPTVKPKRIIGVPATPEQQDRAAETAKEVAAAAPDEKLPGAEQSQKEILGTVAEAIAKRSPVQINYSSAPDEPAAATTANRNARRAMIEAYRDMPDSARALFPKGFSPEQVIVTKTGKYQVQGWAPEVLAANAHRMAEFLSKTGLTTPYEVDPATKSFTPAAWRQLYVDIQTAAANIAGGRTGSGEPLVYPKELLGQGFYKPAEKGKAVALDQDKADFINLLFGMKLPETARITGGKLPLNIAGQEISAATMPGRVIEPLRSRPAFEGPKAAALGIEGRNILEVNPLRNRIEQAAKSAGVEPPSMIEALQHLNLENIKEIQHAPEANDIRGNSMTLTAGFQPRIEGAAVRDDETKFLYRGKWHGEALMNAVHEGANLRRLSEGFVDEAGNFLTREQAMERAKSIGQVSSEIPGNELYSEDLDQNRPTAQFKPGELKPGQRDIEIEGPDGIKYPAKFDGYQEHPTRPPMAQITPQATGPGIFKGGTVYKHSLEAKGFTIPELPTKEQWESERGQQKSLVQFKTKKPDDLKFLGTQFGEPSKAWILPNGKVEQLGAQWHHDWLDQNKDVQKQYGLNVPPFEGGDAEGVREAAIRKGFARVNLDTQRGALTVETREKDWKRVKPIVEDMIDKNLDDIDRFRIHLLDDNAGPQAKKTLTASLFNIDSNKEKMTFATDILNGETPTGQFKPRRRMVGSGNFWQEATRQRNPEFENELEDVRTGKSSGQTFNADGSVWKPSAPTDIVTLASRNIPKDDLGPDAISDVKAAWKQALEKNPGLKIGIFAFDKDGVPTVSIDLNAAVPQEHRKNSLTFAKDNNQVAIWDATNQKEVPSGGTGDTVIKRPEEISKAAAALLNGEPIDIPSLRALNLPEPINFSKASKQTNDEWEKNYADEVQGANPETTRIEFSRDNKGKIKVGKDGPNVKPQYYELEQGPALEGTANKAEALSDKLVDFYDKIKDDPKIIRAKEWYSLAREKLQKFFGADTDKFVQLLAATSPNTGVDTNFTYALDVYNRLKAGKYDDLIKKFKEGADLLSQAPKEPIKSKSGNMAYEGGNELYRLWQKDRFSKGRSAAPPTSVPKTTLLNWWIDQNGLEVRGSEGKLIGMHNDAVITTLTDHWLDTVEGPKTLNFYKNLVGKGFEATIDIWAARTLRRLAYDTGAGSQWRIPWEAETGVGEGDFEFGQKVFRLAADKLGISPDALQAIVWFGEKDNYGKNGWTKDAGADKSDYLQSLEATYRGQHGLEVDKPFRKAILQAHGDVNAARASLVAPREENQRELGL